MSRFILSLYKQNRTILWYKSNRNISIMSTLSNQPSEEMPYIVGHDKSRKEFYIKLKTEDGKIHPDKAVLQYSWIRPDLADLHHTGVPTIFRGKGIAKILAQAAFDFIIAEDAKMRLTCTYLQKYLQDNPLPAYKERVVNGGD